MTAYVYSYPSHANISKTSLCQSVKEDNKCTPVRATSREARKTLMLFNHKGVEPRALNSVYDIFNVQNAPEIKRGD